MSVMDGQTRVSGKRFVPYFLLALFSAIGASVFWANRLEPIRRSAFDKTFPLEVNLAADCKAGAAKALDLHTAGRCSVNGELELGASGEGSAAKFFTWAIVGQAPGEPLPVGKYAAGATGRAPLSGTTPGPHVLTTVISDREADPAELLSALGKAVRPEVPDRLVAVEQFASVLRSRGYLVAVQRLEFHIEK
jgi:hypothetical protein